MELFTKSMFVYITIYSILEMFSTQGHVQVTMQQLEDEQSDFTSLWQSGDISKEVYECERKRFHSFIHCQMLIK